MKRILVPIFVLLAAGFLLACGSSSSNVKDNPTSSAPVVSDQNSNKLTCPDTRYQETLSVETVALEKACYLALSSNMSANITNVVVVNEDKNARTATVEVYATQYGCNFCPEEQVVTLNLFVNVTGAWQIRGDAGFQLTAESEAARIEKQTRINQAALDQSSVTSISIDLLRSSDTIYANVAGTLSKEVWLVVRLQGSDGQTFDYVQLDFGRYARETVANGRYEFQLLYKEGEGIDPNDPGVNMVGYKLVTFQYPGVYPYHPIDVETPWVNTGPF